MSIRNQCIFTTLFVCCLLNLCAQQFVQLETINDPETLKFNLGEKITFKMAGGDQWTRKRISSLLFKDTTIVFDDGLVHLNDISHIQLTRPYADIIGKGFMAFGVSWFVFGGLAALTSQDERTKFGWDSFAIGASAAGTGYLFRKLFYKRTVKMGERYRLRMLDLRMY